MTVIQDQQQRDPNLGEAPERKGEREDLPDQVVVCELFVWVAGLLVAGSKMKIRIS